MVIRRGRNVEHVLNPVRAVGHLHCHPIIFAFVPAAVPINMEAQHVLVEMILNGAIVYNKACVDYAQRICMRRR